MNKQDPESRDIILIGGGGHCQSVIDVAQQAGWRIAGILDVRERVGTDVLGYSVIGTDGDIGSWKDRALFLVTVGQIATPDVRRRLEQKVRDAGGMLATVIAADAYVSPHAVVAEGSVVMHRAVVNAGARIGRSAIINTMANVEHGTVVGDFCHISTGAILNGDCRVGEGSFIGSGTVVSHGVCIAGGSVVSAGSVVRKNLGVSAVYAGHPARMVKRIHHETR